MTTSSRRPVSFVHDLLVFARVRLLAYRQRVFPTKCSELKRSGVSRGVAGRYTSIPTGTKDQYLKYIATMDALPAPEIFGMHDNADITSAQQETADMFATVLGLLPRTTDSGERSREQIIQVSSVQLALAWLN